MTDHPPSAASPLASLTRLTQLANLADALIQRGHEARLIVCAPFVAVRTPHGPGPLERIYLCGGRFHWADSPAGGLGIASQDDIPRPADTIAWALRGGPHAPNVITPAAISSRLYPPGGPAAEPGTP